MLKGKNLQPRILYPVRLSFKIEGEIKDFSNKQNIKEYSNTKHIQRNTERVSLNFFKKREKEEIGWRKPQLESSHLNKPAYRSKRANKQTNKNNLL